MELHDTIFLQTALKATEQSLHKELQFKAIISKLAHALISPSHNINKIADLVIKYAKEITGSRYGYISMIDSKTANGNVFVSLDKTKSQTYKICPKGCMISKEHQDDYIGMEEYLLKKLKPFYTNSPQEHGRYIGFPDDYPKNANFLSVPILINEKPVGQIFLTDTDRDFTDRELKIIEQISEMYALALHHQQFDAEKLELQTQLRHAQKMQAIGTLAGGIAHDFNNILFPIIGYTELAIDSLAKDSKERKYLLGVLKSAHRAKDIVSQILHFSHKSDLKQSPVKLQPVIKEALKLIRASIPATIEMRQSIKNNCSKVMVDSSQMHQIIMNLCTNAWHAMEKEGGIMEIGLDEILISADDPQPHNELKPGRYLKFTVTDNGCGIENSILEQIFDPYFTTKDLNKGTGLGLSIAHGIAKNHGGDIEVLSKPGKGTAFHVYLPCCPNNTRLNNTRQPGIREPEILHKQDGHLLIIDDDEMIVDVEKQMLEVLGYRVTGLTSGLDTIELLCKQTEKVDLIITDQSMPKMTGLKLAKNIKKIRPDIPIIICTGFIDLDFEKEAKDAGICDVILKPLTQKVLSSAVSRVLGYYGTGTK